MVFEKYFREMKRKEWMVKGVRGVEEIRERLVSAAVSSLYACGKELTVCDVVDERCSEGWGVEISAFPCLGGAAGVE